ncbi:Hypothetical predicted protein [Pelobates cultripes]|uniref:Uncharacterized protein n=1 Tax=Pelobates cultripes TaxID=61616 RepID=A0AAD1T274_PELCU|nr:Hypothetical predicted protein [Pelobates cultripes]
METSTKRQGFECFPEEEKVQDGRFNRPPRPIAEKCLLHKIRPQRYFPFSSYRYETQVLSQIPLEGTDTSLDCNGVWPIQRTLYIIQDNESYYIPHQAKKISMPLLLRRHPVVESRGRYSRSAERLPNFLITRPNVYCKSAQIHTSPYSEYPFSGFHAEHYGYDLGCSPRQTGKNPSSDNLKHRWSLRESGIGYCPLCLQRVLMSRILRVILSEGPQLQKQQREAFLFPLSLKLKDGLPEKLLLSFTGGQLKWNVNSSLGPPPDYNRLPRHDHQAKDPPK